MDDAILVVDPDGSTSELCKCGNDAMFLVGIYGQVSHLCETCIAELGKRIIDGLT